MTIDRISLLSKLAIRLAVLVLLFPLPVAAEPAGHWAGVTAQMEAAFNQAQTQAAAGQADTARETIEGAYFDIFEESRMEIIERLHLGMPRVTAVEDLFHKAEDTTSDPKALAKILADLRKALRGDAHKLDASHILPDKKVTP